MGRLDATVRFDSHPFRNPGCRKRDLDDALALKVAEVNTYGGRTAVSIDYPGSPGTPPVLDARRLENSCAA